MYRSDTNINSGCKLGLSTFYIASNANDHVKLNLGQCVGMDELRALLGDVKVSALQVQSTTFNCD